jgi:hypothetical protein
MTDVLGDERCAPIDTTRRIDDHRSPEERRSGHDQAALLSASKSIKRKLVGLRRRHHGPGSSRQLPNNSGTAGA